MVSNAEPAQDGHVRQPRRVFVSYTHDDEQHKLYVLQFCRLLRAHGVDAQLDRYDSDERRDWYTWMIDQVTAADYVLAIASPDYKRVGDGDVPGTCNRGAQSEATLLRELLHSDRPTWTPKLLPVVLPGGSVDEIPWFLQPQSADHYIVTEFSLTGIEELLRTITGQPNHPMPDLGEVPELPPEPLPKAEPRSLKDFLADIDKVCDFVPPRVGDIEDLLGKKNPWSQADRRSSLPIFEDMYELLSEASACILAVEPPSNPADRQRVDEWRKKYLRLRDAMRSAVHEMRKEMETRNPIKYIMYRVPADVGFYLIGNMWDDVRRTRQMLGITNALP